MVLRRRAWLSQEGWYYVAVLAFIVGGAVLRSVNLLIVLAGMMIAPLLLNWRLAMAALRKIDVQRQAPEQICAGDLFTVELTLTSYRRWLGAWLLSLEDTLQAQRRASRDERPLVAKTVVAHLPPAGSATATYQVTIPRRGVYRLGPLQISTRYPLGLVRCSLVLPLEQELAVSPRLGQLTTEWSRMLEADLAGSERRHPQGGIDEGDYYSLRPFQSGDSRRWIHWRTTAKLNSPTVRQFERQRSFDAALVIDPWLPEKPSPADRGRLELALSLAATAVADFCSRGQNQLTITVATPIPQVWSGPTSAAYCREVFDQLARLAGGPSGKLASALQEARAEMPTGARLLVVSPRSIEAAEEAAAADATMVDPGHSQSAFATDSLRWIDVSEDSLNELFLLD